MVLPLKTLIILSYSMVLPLKKSIIYPTLYHALPLEKLIILSYRMVFPLEKKTIVLPLNKIIHGFTSEQMDNPWFYL